MSLFDGIMGYDYILFLLIPSLRFTDAPRSTSPDAHALSLSRVRLRSARVTHFLSLSFVLHRPETRRREILMDITDFKDDARAGIKMVPVLR